MAFYSSSESYSSIAFATVFETENWGYSMEPYLGDSRYFRLDSWTPIEAGEFFWFPDHQEAAELKW